MNSLTILLLTSLILLINLHVIDPSTTSVVAEAAAANEDTASSSAVTTFEVYDNGSSQNGTNITVTETEFNKFAQDDEDAPPGESFAVAMSTRPGVRVSKFKAPEPVIATRAYREDGELITRFEQLKPSDDGSYRRVYLVADGLEFMWPFVELGHRQTISPNVVPPTPAGPLILESASESPRVFRVFNIASEVEANAIINTALNATGKNQLKRSTVGSGTDDEGNDLAREDFGRTSDNAWDHESPEAKVMITRSFQLTNIEENAGKRDGLQVVRYNPGQGYNTHPDYFREKDDVDFDFNPYSGGSNRFATVFMYLNDPEEGGCTVFPRAPSAGPAREMPEIAKDMFKKGTWEHTVNKECYTKLAVPPKLGTAALFYSVTPDGRIDPKSHHAACPLIKGTKWGANIWIWNKQRFGDIRTGDPRTVGMKNRADETVYISWEGKDSGTIAPGKSMKMNSFEYHRFKASFNSHKEKAFAEFTVQSEPDHQEWEIKRPRRQQHALEEDVPVQPGALKVMARNTLDSPIYITWEDNPTATIEAGASTKLNTFEGHTFKASLGSWAGEEVESYHVKPEPIRQVWNIEESVIGDKDSDDGDNDNDEEKGDGQHDEL